MAAASSHSSDEQPGHGTGDADSGAPGATAAAGAGTPEPDAGTKRSSSDRRADDDGEHESGSDGTGDIFRGRPDLSQDALQELRMKHKELKQEQQRVRKQMKAQSRKRARILQRMRHLDTAAVLQVLMERGVDFNASPAPAAAAPP